MPATPIPIVRWLARLICRIFYRVDTVGGAPPAGALLLFPNHPNALLDPAVVWATAGRDVRFLAKSTLFDGPLRPLLAAAGAIPVYRRMDKGADVSKNTETFAAVADALAAGDAVCLFPEGISHSSGRLEPLRTGAARMAIAAETAGTRVTLVAVGLNFDRKAAFRSRVTVVYGRPFFATDLVPAENAGDHAAVQALTDRIGDHMRGLLIEADPDADQALVDRVDRIYAAARGRSADPAERVERRRVIAAGIDRLRTDRPDHYDDILLQVRRYDERLRRFGLRDRHLDWSVSTREAVDFAAREILFAIVLVPLCVVGFVLGFVPYHVTWFVARLTTKASDVIATAQVFTGAAIYAAWFALIAGVVWWQAGGLAALAVAIALPFLASAALVAIERESAVLDAVRAWLLLRRAHSSTRDRLRRRRSELADILDDVHEWMEGAGSA
jgi:glycerol-3-phosphate O-acyltransferase / dihydroxyacetone phosphate acyltransferase